MNPPETVRRQPRGVVACGHPITCDAAVEALAAGGNAFDAVAAGLWTACVAEPVLASPGGGGFLLARPAGEADRVYDFFTHTPRCRREPGDADFRAIEADFGTTRQTFHIGLGSAATPGMVAGLFAFQKELGRLPRARAMAHAIDAARNGVPVNTLQGYICQVVAPILEATPSARAAFGRGDRVLGEGDLHRPTALADLLDALSREGPELFYQGEVAEAIDRACTDGGGHLRRADLGHYQVGRREPLAIQYRNRRVLTNPPTASGGLLVAFGLSLLEGRAPPGDPDGVDAALRTAAVLAATADARLREGIDSGAGEHDVARMLDPRTLDRYRGILRAHPASRRGTTHISVIDAEGNAASATVSNGEGCGWVVPGAGFMLNNMLGESDLQPRGFGAWPPDVRLTSMMAPTLVEDRPARRLLALGSGGSNRIRSAILQVLCARLDYALPLEVAVARPRLHVEGQRLDIENGFRADAIEALRAGWTDHCVWSERSLFFGGVHAVEATPGGFIGAGDPRRGGSTATA